MIFTLAGCRQDNVSPIRNVRFDPKLLNPLKAAGGCTNYSYFSGAKLRNLGTINTSRVVVAFDENLTQAQREQVITRYGFVAGIHSQRASQTGMMFTLNLMNGLNCAQTEQAIRELAKDKAIKYAGPYFVMDGNQQIGLSNEVMVKTDAGGVPSLKEFAANYHAKLIGPLGADTYLLQVDKYSRGNALELSDLLKEQKGIAHATPDFILAQ
ncbi:hypothetical protein H8S95_13385 [Pontibacter sp. KCTC 32443]|uniref:hypothetical protein n=1 Tax=Pontibacter TaxID=323449 RepID=UPI00164D60D2|nr:MULTISPECIES: hypothetical protein [Pontibacter]MBC5775064.1 hypothetical protein [Pontibacter sp. KCTC 32443]